MTCLLNESNLKAGIDYFGKKKAHWDRDFHNAIYKNYYEKQQLNGLDENWWKFMVDQFGPPPGWSAIRPKKKAYILKRGLERLEQLQAARDRILRAIEPQRPGLENTKWELLSELYSCAKSIKNVDSPVFGSKLCHFIIPNVFPIIDREAVGFETNDYARYWDFCRRQWLDCQVKEKLEAHLRMVIGQEIVDYYPWSTKLTELCIIGNGNST